jgi:predicted DNA-binding protein (UPF0251 family)
MRPRPLRRSSTRSSVTPGAGAKALSARGTEIFSRDDTVNESEHGEGRCRRGRGRPRARRMIGDPGAFRCFGPLCGRPDEVVAILPEEVEALRLVDLAGLEQEEAAHTLGVSRKTLWRDLHEARRKVADALVNGKTIRIAGCGRQQEEGCPEDGKTHAGPSSG